MKLIYCTECRDVVNLDFVKRECKCGRSSGRYIDSLNAVYSGPCVPLGINNMSLRVAVEAQPVVGLGDEFTAFVIAKVCKTAERLY